MDRIKALFTWLRTHAPRMTLPNLISTCLVLVVVSVAPHQAPVLTYKLALILLAACACYMLDVSLFYYAKPSGYLAQPWRDDISFKPSQADFGVAAGCQALFIAACARRCLIVCAGMLAVALAL